MTTCKCTCGWPVHTDTPITVDCPQCSKQIKCLSEIGLGDRVEWCISLIGGEIYKRIYHKIFKKECGCKKRKNWLNDLFRKLMMLVTSFSPTRVEAQHKALATWKRFDLPIVAVQCIGEDYAKDFTDNIVWVKPNLHWSKRTPSITDLIKQASIDPIILINSDIEIDLDSLDDWKPEPRILKIGLRTDYHPKFTQLNKYGIDVFLITPEMREHLTNNIWATGVPGWDYWITYKLINEGYKLDIVDKGFLHEAHIEQWNQGDYRRCGKLLEFEFDIPIQDIADTLQQVTGRTRLTKRVVT